MNLRRDAGRECAPILPVKASIAGGRGGVAPAIQESSCGRREGLRRGECGQTTSVMAIFMATFLLGFVGLAIDVQSLFHARRMAQAAADGAAVAAAEEAVNGASSEQSAANAIAKLNGFDTTLATNPATVTIATPTSGNYSGSSSYIQVTVSQPISTFFSSIVTHQSTVTVSARAVAAAGLGAPSCVCLESTSGMDLNMSNNSKLSPTGCGTTVDSASSNAVGVVGGSTLSGKALGMVSSTWNEGSEVNNGGSITASKIITGLASTCSPPVPAIPSYSPSFCTADPLSHYGSGGSSYSVGPGSTYSTTQGGSVVCYNSLTVGSNGDKVNLNAGIYVINNGELHFESGANNLSNTGGNGVFFYLVGTASLVIDNGANVNLTAPGSGTYSGILIFQDSADSAAMSVQGGSNTVFNGAIYAPASNVTLGNGSSTTINAELVANTLTMNGGGTLNSTAVANFGTLSTSVAKLTE